MMAINFTELLGAMTQGGMAPSAGSRVQQAASSMGDGVQGALGKLLSGGQAAVNRAGQAVGGKDNLAAAGVGALLGALSSERSTVAGGIGGGVLGLLGMMAFKALKGAGQNGQNEPVVSAAPSEDDAKLLLTAMLNAAKADGQVDQEELNRITARIKETGVGPEGLSYVVTQLQTPISTDAIVQAVHGRPDMAAQVYSASLMAIEVDTDAERSYLDGLARAMGLSPQTAQNIEQLMGMAQAR